MDMLREGSNAYVMNLEDDHFLQMDSKKDFFELINFAAKNKVDCIHGTFFQMIKNTYVNIPREYSSKHGSGFRFTQNVFDELGWDESTIFCGNNCVFSRDYALNHWGKGHSGPKPHPFEETEFNSDKEFNIIVLESELMRPIDDDHGILNSCCLANPDNKKWNAVWREVSTSSFYRWKSNYSLKEKSKKVPYLRRFVK